jgi:hypothetical protein
MSNSKWVLLIACLVAWGAFWRFAPAESERPEIAPPKWEYMTFPLGNAAGAVAKLNANGDKGWELVAVSESNAYFKRRK